MAIHITFLLSIVLLTKQYSAEFVGLILLLIHYSFVQYKYCNVAACPIKCYKTSMGKSLMPSTVLIRFYYCFFILSIRKRAPLHIFQYWNASSESITDFAPQKGLAFILWNVRTLSLNTWSTPFRFLWHWLFYFRKGDSVKDVRSKDFFNFKFNSKVKSCFTKFVRSKMWIIHNI